MHVDHKPAPREAFTKKDEDMLHDITILVLERSLFCLGSAIFPKVPSSKFINVLSFEMKHPYSGCPETFCQPTDT